MNILKKKERSFVVRVIQSGGCEHGTPRVKQFAPVLELFAQAHLFGFVVGVVRINGFLQRDFVPVQTQVDLVVQKVHPLYEGFAFVQIGRNRVFVQ